MSSDELIQKNLFGNDDDGISNKVIKNEIVEYSTLDDDDLKKDSQNRPRKKKNSKSNQNIFHNKKKEKSISVKSHSFQTVSKNNLSPVLLHYVNLKEENCNHLLLYRLGDFFECFFEDAILISQLLGIALTSKEAGKEIGRVPMAGIPHHALERYCAELIKANYSIVVCDQLEKSTGKYGTPIKRGITRIITPGTVIEEGMLVAKKNNWITAIFIDESHSQIEHNWGISRADVSTGELITIEGKSINKLCDELTKLDASELIIGSEEEEKLLHSFNKQIKCTITKKTSFGLSEATKMIRKTYNINSLEGLGLKNHNQSTQSLGGLLAYLKQINPSDLDNESSLKISLDVPQIKFPHENLIIDYQTQKNLEITHTQRENNYIGSLLWSIDRTFTSMGARCLRRWIELPLINIDEISKRQNVIANFIKSKELRTDAQNLLRAMGDLERLAGRACAGQATARDLIAIAEGLKKLPQLQAIVNTFEYDLPVFINELKKGHFELLDLADSICNTIVDNPPLNVSEGGLIHDGVDHILDGLRNMIDDYLGWLKKEEINERKISKINNLKIQFHRTFGYYISVNKSKTNLAPNHWTKKQTLTNEERYITTAIKSQENKIFNVKNRLVSREYELFVEVRNLVSKQTEEIRRIARAIASLDALLGLSITSIENNFVKPQIIPMDNPSFNKKTTIDSGRNPIVEQLLDDTRFIPNDIEFHKKQRLIILTGPNASGKSCYIRQVGLIQILAQIGSYIPAKKADIQLVDRVFTRVGAVDDQSTGQSTFMVEMSETAMILNQATSHSLVLLDEIGRGTATFDGLSIAWSVSEYLARKIKCNTIFATHYHELNYLEKSLDNVTNFQVTVNQNNDILDFCHKIIKGGSNKSYGIEVAKLAGVPKEVVKKAKQILNQLEESNNFNHPIQANVEEEKIA